MLCKLTVFSLHKFCYVNSTSFDIIRHYIIKNMSHVPSIAVDCCRIISNAVKCRRKTLSMSKNVVETCVLFLVFFFCNCIEYSITNDKLKNEQRKKTELVETCRASLVVSTPSVKLFFNNLIFYTIRRSRTHG